MQERIELLYSLYEYLPKLYNGIEQNVKYYRTNEIAMADELIISVVDGLSWSIDAIVLIMESILSEGGIQGIQQILMEMLGAIENADKVLIADILEYELLDKVEEWFNFTEKVLAQQGKLEVNE